MKYCSKNSKPSHTKPCVLAVSQANALGVENVGGIFVVLMAGLALAVLVAICEFVWRSRRNAREDKVRGRRGREGGGGSEREREGGREGERERERESVCVCACVCVTEREREERERE